MTRKHEQGPAGSEARRLTDGLFRRAVLVPAADSERGANEGLGLREILALQEENARPWGLCFAESVIACRARRAGHGDCACIPGSGRCQGTPAAVLPAPGRTREGG
jgi:hypothetical protein